MISGSSFDTVPWFLPGAAVSLVLSLALCGPLARALGIGRVVAWLLLMSLGLILVTTLTPQREALELGAVGSGTCDFSRVTLAPLDFYGGANDAGENVLLFVPLGIAIGLLPPSRRRVAIVGGVLLPVAIEIVQRQAVVLNRSCQSADVVDNLAGLVIGLAIGATASVVMSMVIRRRAVGDPSPPPSTRQAGG